MASLVQKTGTDILGEKTTSSTGKGGQPANEIVLELDSPIFVQSLENKSVNLICANCGVHLPSLDAQVKVFQDYSLVQKVYTKSWCTAYLNDFDASAFDRIVDANEKSFSIKEKVRDVCACDLGCGSLYCTPQCQDYHRTVKGHNLLCVGPVSEDHPLYTYSVLSMESGEYEVFTMAANIVAYAFVQTCKSADSQFLSDVTKGMPLWSTYMFLKDQEEDRENDDNENLNYEEAKTMREQFVSQMFELLRDGLRSEDGSAFKNFTRTAFSKILSYVTIKGFEITNRPSSLTKFCQNYLPLLFSETTDEANVMDGPNAPIFATLCNMISDMYYDYNVETEEDEAMYMNNSMMLRELLMDSPRYFDGIDGISLYPKLVTAEAQGVVHHSCIPSCEIDYKHGQWHNASLKANLKWVYKVISFNAGDGNSFNSKLSVCINAPVDADYSYRNKMLALVSESMSLQEEHGSAEDNNIASKCCSCFRCHCEKMVESQETGIELRNIPEKLLEIAYLYQKLGNYDLAIKMFQEAASRLQQSQPLKGVALYEAGRTMAWNDNWHEGYEFLNNADATIDVTNEDLKRNLKGVHAYYPYSEIKLADSALNTAENVMHITQENEIRSKYVEITVPNHNSCKVFATKDNTLFGKDICAKIIKDVEQYLVQNGGWTTSRHYSVPTTDVPVHNIPSALEAFNRILETKLFPSISVMYQVPVDSLRVIDAFVVKYNSKRQRKLPIHVDQSQFSFTVSLNDMSEYRGGGLYLPDRKEVLNANAGGVIMFNGATSHGGYPVFDGTRYIIAVFCYSTQHAAAKAL